MQSPIFSVSDAVAVLNQTLDYAYPTITIVGEISSFNVSKGKWLYFDIKDDGSKLKCFGTVFQLKMPIEDGMMVELIAKPKLHNLYGFSLNVVSLRPFGEGSIKKAAALLQEKLKAEGLFAPERKRAVPRAPEAIGLISSEQSAGYADFIKIMHARWQGVSVELYDALVQGADAPDSIISGIHYFSQLAHPPEVVVIIRGGGSADDLSAFSDEAVVRAVSASRIPTLVAIGHEVDTSLAELAADMRASTPSNAAELLFPDKAEVRESLTYKKRSLEEALEMRLNSERAGIEQKKLQLTHAAERVLLHKESKLSHAIAMLHAIHPKATLKRGYALIEHNGRLVATINELTGEQDVQVTMHDGKKKIRIKEI
jgi:exodeoxyribonuclease VII large subunit